MFNRYGSLKITAAVLASTLLAGCGLLTGGSDDKKETLVVGTTEAPSVLDPAGAWDGSWALYRNIFQTLMQIPISKSTPEPDAAKRCVFKDADYKVYQCDLRTDITFSDGERMDARAVKHSFDRLRSVHEKLGPAPLLAVIRKVETKGDNTVVFRLKKADATFPFLLSTPAASLVSPKAYPKKQLRPGYEIVGSGPYKLKAYRKGKEAELEKNEDYKGAAKVRNEGVTIRYFQKSGALMKAFRDKQLDVIYRGLTPHQIQTLQKESTRGDSVDLTENDGSEIRYLAFNTKSSSVSNPAVRKAIAQMIDRKALVRNVYQHTAEPLYSMVPSGIPGHTSPFFDLYKDPDTAKAKSILRSAGIDQKVKLTLWYTTDRYGATTAEEFQEIKRQLNGSGLFDVTVKGKPWDEFQAGYSNGKYAVFGRGWQPDFPDADNYITPFVGTGNVLSIPNQQTKILDDLLPRSRRETNRASAADSFGEAQKLLAQDARVLPLWQGKIYTASHPEVAGMDFSVDSATIMRMWELYTKSSW
ncbi:ABC transporter substrate-binding protein [Streptomyces sp. NPDC005438]|uniref:ABC transporter substrate-binding protein n=1 Tax=Streptomyces sp. NPDC005438 TaxID=3156880 RepID=UPI0033B6FBB2